MLASRIFNVYVLFFVISIVGYMMFPPFRTWGNATSLLSNSAPIIMVAVAQFFAMLVWGVDLSVGSIMNVVIVAASFLLDAPLEQMALGIVLCALLGALLGLINGVLIVALKLPDFVVTMATFIGFQGIALSIRPTPGGGVNPDFQMFMYSYTYGLPNSFWVLIPILLILAYVLRQTRFGHYMIAVGSHRESSQLLGLPVGRIRIGAYVMSGLCAAIAGIFLMGLIGTGSAEAAAPYQLNSIIATVIGGTSLYGGQGSVFGTLFGALILQVVLKMLTYANLLGSYILVFQGTMVVVVVGLVTLAQNRSLLRALLRPRING